MAHNDRNASGEKPERMIHIRLKPDTHRRLRVRAAEEDVTIQDWVMELIERELSGFSLANRRARKVAGDG